MSELAVMQSEKERFVAVRDDRYSVTVQKTDTGLRVLVFDGDELIHEWESDKQPGGFEQFGGPGIFDYMKGQTDNV